MAEGKAFGVGSQHLLKGEVRAVCTPAPPRTQTPFSVCGCAFLPPGCSAQLHSPSNDLEGETAGLFVSDFAGLWAGEAGADFSGEPGSSAAVSFSPENTEKAPQGRG